MKNKNEVNDERFSQIEWHPKFRRVPRHVRKVKIDKRFEQMFNDPKFKLKQAVDKRGRPLAKSSNEDLHRYYDLSSSSDEEEEIEKKSKPKKQRRKDKTATKDRSVRMGGHGSPEQSEHDEDVAEQDQKRIQEKGTSDDEASEDEEEETIKFDLARGEGNISTSSDDSSSDWELEEEDEEQHEWADIDSSQAPTVDNGTTRLAICNMDWERITARDLVILLNSVKPSSGLIRYVKVYPSDFGLRRMEAEQKRGPLELQEMKEETDEEEGEEEEEEEEEEAYLDNVQEERQKRKLLEKLRQYEFNRLKYYYAVVECDSVETAEFIYSNCDGMEYELSGTRLDLRFIADDMEFDHQPKDEAIDVGDLSTYQPNKFVNRALQQSKPVLSWEEERNPKRVEVAKRAFEDPSQWDRLELSGVLASPSNSEESGDEEFDEGEDDSEKTNGKEKVKPGKIEKKDYKSILLNDFKSTCDRTDEKEESDVEMEIRWDPSIEENIQKTTDDGEDDKNGKKMSQWEKYLERRKEKRRQRKEEIKRKRMAVKRQRFGIDDDAESDLEEIGNKKKKKRRKRKTNSESANEEDEVEKKKREAELQLLLAESDEESKRKHFNLKKLLKEDAKGRKKKTGDEEMEEEFNMKTDDPRFSAVFTSHLYNIDPSDPAFKKTPGMKRLIEEKVKSKTVRGGKSILAVKADGEVHTEEPGVKSVDEINDRKNNMELSSLVKRVKVKSDLIRKQKEKRRAVKTVS